MEKLADFNISENPFETFNQWHSEALSSEINADAFAFGTSNSKGQSSVRYLLYKGLFENKFKIYGSNYSRKAQDLKENAQGSMAFFWPNKMYQIRIDGIVHPMPRQLVEDYFNSRPKDSQVASAISLQSTALESRTHMVEKFENYQKEYADKNLETPQFWTGWLLEPSYFEFFIYREHRLNDRFAFKKNKNGEFDIQRIWP